MPVSYTVSKYTLGDVSAHSSYRSDRSDSKPVFSTIFGIFHPVKTRGMCRVAVLTRVTIRMRVRSFLHFVPQIEANCVDE